MSHKTTWDGSYVGTVLRYDGHLHFLSIYISTSYLPTVYDLRSLEHSEAVGMILILFPMVN